MSVGRLIIGSRGSDLALWQARHVQAMLLEHHPGIECPIEIIRTQGDAITDRPLQSIADGKGFFTKELEEALLAGRIDLAVHSLKDLPTVSPEGLQVAAIPRREDPHDVWLGSKGPREIQPGARIGTASLRRKAQLRAFRPDLMFEDLRGNVPTRVRKLTEGQFDAVVLARAGLFRLGLLPPDAHELPFEILLPAPAQGALGIQTRSDDTRVRQLVGVLEDSEARLAVTAERALLNRLEGGCLVPVGAFALLRDENEGRRVLHLDAMVASLDGTEVLRADAQGVLPEARPAGEGANRDADAEAGGRSVEAARLLGVRLAEDLLARGADRILSQVPRR